MDTVLVIGGAGFIGSHLCRLLLANKYTVRVLDSLSVQVHGAIPTHLTWLASGDIDFMRGSITSRKDIERALKGADHIVHLAAETGTGQSMYEVARYNEVNSQGTALLFDVLANAKSRSVQRVVLASSRSVYGEGAYMCVAGCCNSYGSTRQFPAARRQSQLAAHHWEPTCSQCGKPLIAVPTHEEDRVQPASIYAATKYAQEDIVRVGCNSLGIGYTILRLQNVYGEGQSLKNPYTGILSIFSTRARRDLELTIFEDGLESRDFVHVTDVTQAILRALSTESPVDTTINVGSGRATPVLEAASRLSEILTRTPKIRTTAEYRLGDIRHNFADISRLRTILNYTPQIDFKDGLRLFCDWVVTQPIPEDQLDQANAELRHRNLMG